MIKFDVVTLFPNLFKEYLEVLPFKRAIEKKFVDINLWDLKKYSVNKYGSVDDKPYGGGKGMIISIEPVFKVLSDIYKTDDIQKWHTNKEKQKIILLTPRGKKFNQKTVQELTTINSATIICGRYEGVDARIEEYFATDLISLGDFVLSGGEIAATAILESVIRTLPGILEDEVTQKESFVNDVVEYPQYTRPEDFMGMKVPEVLLSGNHEQIERWRKSKERKVTA